MRVKLFPFSSLQEKKIKNINELSLHWDISTEVAVHDGISKLRYAICDQDHVTWETNISQAY